MVEARSRSGEQTHDRQDARKSAVRAPKELPEGAHLVCGYQGVRAMLRDPDLVQAGFKAELVEQFRGSSEPPILFMSGGAHRQRRKMSAHFFSPQKVRSDYRPLIEAATTRLVEQFRAKKEAQLDQISLVLAVEVAATIIGLTNSNPMGLTRRLDAFFTMPKRQENNFMGRMRAFLRSQFHLLHFFLRDVRPAIAARRRALKQGAPKEDVITHLLSEKKPTREILAECVTYGAAGMVTTREFITMAAWHLLEHPELRKQFVDGTDAVSGAILEEILRLEPVVGTLFRRDTEQQIYALDIRSANTDGEAFGDCPYKLIPNRATAQRVPPYGLSFGDGSHRCPGSEVALLETAIFLKALLRVPGLEIRSAPQLGWNDLVAGYELRSCIIVCD